MASIGDFFGKGSIGEQFFIWGVLQGLVNAAITPGLQEITNLVNSGFPEVPLSPEAAANMVARAILDAGTASSDAAAGGTNGTRFAEMVKAAGSAVDLSTAVAAYQRKLIGEGGDSGTEVSLNGALADQGIRAEWFGIVKQLAVNIPSIAEVMNAWLEGQIEEPEALTRYLAAGGDPTWFQTSYNANGQAPTPVEALTMLNRGIIPESGTGPASISYEQAFLEGPWRNKWLQPFLALRDYYPPPRTITAMFHAGQLTHDQAATYLMKQGLSADLAAAYLSPSTKTATATAKTLTEAQIVSLYADKIVTHGQAVSMLGALKYSATDADYILQLHDVSSTASAISKGVSSVRALYEAGKLTDAEAEGSLVTLGIAQPQAVEIVTTWRLTRVPVSKFLTAAQTVDAWYYTLITPEVAIGDLVQLGYTELDAWILLSIKNKGPLAAVPRPAG